MTINEARETGVVVVSPQGRIDSTTSATLDRYLQGLATAGDKRVVVDFTGVDYKLPFLVDANCSACFLKENP